MMPPGPQGWQQQQQFGGGQGPTMPPGQFAPQQQQNMQQQGYYNGGPSSQMPTGPGGGAAMTYPPSQQGGFPGGPGNFGPPGIPQQQMPPPAPAPVLNLAPSAFADLLPLALSPKAASSPKGARIKVKQDSEVLKSLTESRADTKKFEKVSTPTLNDLKQKKAGPKPKPPQGNNFISFDDEN